MNVKLLSVLSVLFWSQFTFAQVKFEDLKIDMTITGFQFAADFQGTKIFTKNGPPDIQTINPTAFSFTIADNMTAATAKSQLEMLLNMSLQNEYKILDLVRKDTVLNGHSSYYISYIETDERNNYKNFVFNAFVLKDNTIILFSSGDLDAGKYHDSFKKTFFRIKL